MLRRTVRTLWAKNPHGPTIQNFEKSSAYRSEKVMFKVMRGPKYDIPSDRRYREIFKYMPHGIPRDCGEIPRNYILRMVYFNQPITAAALWEELKKQTDTPVDSRRHMTLVLKMARIEEWVYFEKNQDSNDWVMNITRERYPDVQRLVTEHRDSERTRADEASAREAQEKAVQAVELTANEEAYVGVLHRELLAAAERLRGHDSNAYAALPFLGGPEGYDLTWYKAKTTTPAVVAKK